MKFNKLVAALSAVTMLGSLAAAVPASAADEIYTPEELSTEKTLTLPVNGYIFQNMGKIKDDTSYKPTNGVRSVVQTANNTYQFQVAAVPFEKSGTTYVGARVKKTEQALAALSDADVSTGVALSNTTNLYIPFDKELEITEVSLTSFNRNATSEASAVVLALVKDGDYYVTNTDVNSEGTTESPVAAKTVISSDNWSRANNSGVAKIDSNYTFTQASTYTDVAKLSLKDTGTPQKYVGLFIDGNNNPFTVTELTIKYHEVPDTAVAKVGDKYYGTFEDAFGAAPVGASANPTTIELLKDINIGAKRFVLNKSNTGDPTKDSDTTYKHNVHLLLKGNDHTITTENNQSFLFEGNGRTITLENVTISGDPKIYVINAKNASTVTLTNVAVSGNKPVVNTNSNGSTVTTTNLDVTNAENNTAIVVKNTNETAGCTMNIGLTSALAENYTVVDGVLKAKAPSYWEFGETDGFSYNGVSVTAKKGDVEQTKQAGFADNTTITGPGSLYVMISGVPFDVSIESVKLIHID